MAKVFEELFEEGNSAHHLHYQRKERTRRGVVLTALSPLVHILLLLSLHCL